MNANVQDDLRVDLVFEGQILAGHDREQVRRAIGERFKLDDARLDRMFAGAPYVLKRGMAPDEASRYIALFARLGARLMAKSAAQAAADQAMRTDRPAPLPEPAAAAPAAAVPLALAPAPDVPAAAPEPFDALRHRAAASAPETMLVVEDAADPAPVFGVGFAGRLGRRQYGAAALFGWAAIRWAMMGLAHHPRGGTAALIVAGMVVAMLWTFRLTVLRLHDIGGSGWWVLLGPIPIVGTIAGLLLAAVPGSTGENRFGREPEEGSLVLRYVVLAAVVCIGAGFRHGLLFGDGGGRGAQAVDLHAASPDAPPAAPTDDELNAVIKSAAARRDFREGYWPAKTHKAFAVSDSGASGWSADLGTADAAKAQALAQCDKARDAYSAECHVLQVDGDWSD